MDFEIIGEVNGIEIIASGSGIRDRKRLSGAYGGKKWRKLKGNAQVRLIDGTIRLPKSTGTKRTG